LGISQQKEQQQDGTGSAFFDNLDEKIVSTRLVGLRVSKIDWLCYNFAIRFAARAIFLIQSEVKQKPIATHSGTFSSSDLFTGMSMSFVIGLSENTQLKVLI